VAPKIVHTQDVKKEPEVHQGVALHMVGVIDVKRKAATKEPRARPSSVKHMVGGGAVNFLGVPRVLRVVLIAA
jgi:hypothetical protein